MASLGDNPAALAALIEAHGGRIIEGPKMRFECELGNARKVIGEIQRLGLDCDRVPNGERQGNNFQGKACSFVTFSVVRQSPKTTADESNVLMRAIIR
jgi:hypothetical protein